MMILVSVLILKSFALAYRRTQIQDWLVLFGEEVRS